MNDLATLQTDPRLLARRDSPATSKEAAARVSEFENSHHRLIVKALKEIGKPAGAEEIGALIGMDAYKVRRRLPELQRAGFVRLTNETRQTVTGRSERLWRAANV